MRIIHMISIAAACALVEPALAHDFWLEADEYQTESGASVEIGFFVGHDDERAPWSLRKERIVAFHDHAPGGSVDRIASIRPDNNDRPGAASLSFAESGTHILAFESRPSTIELPAARFNDHIGKEGLTLAIAARANNKQTSAPGRERYSRRAKLLAQVGDSPTDNALAPVGHALEIAPEKNPYALAEDETLPVRVLFHGQPLAGALIDLESLSLGVLPIVTKMTDDRGRAEFSLPKTGAWKLNVIWTTPLAGNEDADFDTIFASLTFGYGDRKKQ